MSDLPRSSDMRTLFPVRNVRTYTPLMAIKNSKYVLKNVGTSYCKIVPEASRTENHLTFHVQI